MCWAGERRSALWKSPQRCSEKRGKLKTICVHLNRTNRGKGRLFGMAAGDDGNVTNPAWQQGKVNLGEYLKLPRQLGWAAQPGDTANSLNRVIRKHRAGFIRKHRVGSALILAQRTSGCENLISYFNQPPQGRARLDLPRCLCKRFVPCSGLGWGAGPRVGTGAAVPPSPGQGVRRRRGKAEVTAVA